jgi:rubredoxin
MEKIPNTRTDRKDAIPSGAVREGDATVTVYRCDVCEVYEYDSDRGDADLQIPAGREPADFPDDWACPICGADKTHLQPV